MPQPPQVMKILHTILLNMVPKIYKEPQTKRSETDISTGLYLNFYFLAIAQYFLISARN
jgi:hypothetical protein